MAHETVGKRQTKIEMRPEARKRSKVKQKGCEEEYSQNKRKAEKFSMQSSHRQKHGQLHAG